MAVSAAGLGAADLIEPLLAVLTRLSRSARRRDPQPLRSLRKHGGFHWLPVVAAALGHRRAVIGIVSNLAVSRYRFHVGTRINSATLIAQARHSWLDALLSAGRWPG